MTLDEIKRREQRVTDARENLKKAQAASREAKEEYAAEQAEKAGIVYGETKVMTRGKGPFFVIGLDSWFLGRAFYKLAKVKQNGKPSKAGSGVYHISLDDLAIVEAPDAE